MTTKSKLQLAIRSSCCHSGIIDHEDRTDCPFTSNHLSKDCAVVWRLDNNELAEDFGLIEDGDCTHYERLNDN